MTSDGMKGERRSQHEDGAEQSRLGLIRYWRTCLADVGLGKGRFRERDLPPDNRQLVELSKDELSCGRVERRNVEVLFRNVDKNLDHVQVCLWPLVAGRRTSHGTGRGDGLPDHVAPIVSVARVAREDGAIRPMRTVIARDLLEPLPEGAFSIGTVEDLDTFLTESPFSSSSDDELHDGVWQQYRDDCGRLLKTVAAGWPGQGSGYERTGKGLIEVAGDPAVMVRNILALYDTILRTNSAAPLLESCPLLASYAVAGKEPPLRAAMLRTNSRAASDIRPTSFPWQTGSAMSSLTWPWQGKARSWRSTARPGPGRPPCCSPRSPENGCARLAPAATRRS